MKRCMDVGIFRAISAQTPRGRPRRPPHEPDVSPAAPHLRRHRRYYLLGRDRLIAGLQPDAGASVLEIGCGTGRNLVHAARLYPDARFFGIDVSTEMLTSAMSAISRRGLTDRIRVAHGDGTAFDPQTLVRRSPSFDHILISYSLSMIPDWRRVLQAAVSRLKPGGRLHIVDFGGQERLPGIARALLRRWLAMFDVTPRDDLEARAVGDGRCMPAPN